MKNRKTRLIRATLIACAMFPVGLLAQEETVPVKTKFKVRGYLNGGYEHNLFYAPESFRRSNGTMMSQDSLINSGAFSLIGSQFSMTRQKQKKTFLLDAGGYYKYYFANRLRKFDNYNIELTPGFQYNFRKSDYLKISAFLGTNKMTRALTLDEESIIPLSYYRANPSLAYQRLFFKKISARISAGYDFRKYKESTNGLDFTHGEFNAQTRLKYRHKIKKATMLYKADYSIAHRTYFNWSSDDSQTANISDNLDEDSSFSFNQNKWVYHRLGLGISSKLNNHFVAGIQLNMTRKLDASNTDFGFLENGLRAEIAYKHNNLRVALTSGISQRKYDKRRTFVATGEGEQLIYNYFTGRIRADYALTPRLGINASFLMRNRKSNSTLETRVTRRSYNYFTVMGGVTYKLDFIRKTKKAKKL